MSNTIFTGKWISTHWYPTQDDSAEETDSYQMTAHQRGHEVVFESQVQPDGSYMLIRLHIDGELVTGTWEEASAPGGEFEGVTYSGAGQLLLNADKSYMEGKWAGIGFNHQKNKAEIYTGRWELKRQEW